MTHCEMTSHWSSEQRSVPPSTALCPPPKGPGSPRRVVEEASSPQLIILSLAAWL